ncbi:MAG TPA: ATP-dependent helicase C-terminal domain-containing protein, partial [Deferrisomatales bacterium]|nr:ATP-dependent helicase C-terminal domain-containing protein [Deferrisomatales bacterium]
LDTEAFCRALRWDPGSGVDRLELERISLASAAQRAGRAGRTGPGLALRLWTRHDEQGLRPRQPPEIHRLDLAGTLLQVLGWGHPDPATFPWFEAPTPRNLASAMELLQLLGAVDTAGRLTPDGERLRRLPLHPRLGRLVLYAAERGLAHQGALLAALLSEGDVLGHADRSPQRGEPAVSDLLLRLEHLEAVAEDSPSDATLHRHGLEPGATRSVLRAAAQIERQVTAAATSTSPLENPGPFLLQAVLRAYPDRVARRLEPGVVQLVGGRRARLEPGCAVREAGFLVAARLRGGQRGAFSADRVEWASAIDPVWLEELQDLERTTSDHLDLQRGRVVRRELTTYRGLPITSRELPPPREQAAALLIAHLLADFPNRLALSAEARTLVARCRFLGPHLPRLNLPGWDRDDWEHALQAPALAAAPSLEHLFKTNLLPHLEAALTWEQRAALERDAPARVRVASGNHLRVDYAPTEQGRPPVLAVKIQELFGCREGPRVAAGRVPLLLHLLGPHGRPIQVTDDLMSFWQRGYPEVRKELRGRYPRHRWPEDPLTAEPSRSSVTRRRH